MSTVSEPAESLPDYALGQWLSGSTAKAYRPTLDALEAAGYVVAKRDDLVDGGMVPVSRESLRALIAVCQAGLRRNGSASDALRHIEQRLAARLIQDPAEARGAQPPA